MREDKDRGSKWMIDHHGDSILRLGGVTNIRAWRAAQTTLVQPGQSPDGLLEVFLADEQTPVPFLVEVSTYPQQRSNEQVLRDVMMVFLDRHVVPEVITLVLHPKGQYCLTGTHEQASQLGWTRFTTNWRVVELWTVPAEELLAANDVGLMPWVPLTRFDGAPEPILQMCSERIEREAPPEEKDTLFAVAQIMTRLRYNNVGLMALFGGKKMFTDSPLIQELFAEKLIELIVEELTERFGGVPSDITTVLLGIVDEDRLKSLVKWACHCPDLEAFRSRLMS